MDPAEVAAHIRNLSQQTDTLNERVNNLQLKTQELKLYITQTLAAKTPEPKASLPDLFSGDRQHYRDFINSLNLLFELRPRTYSTDKIKVCTAISYLRREPRAWANTYLEKDDPILYSYENFIAAMSLLYDDSSKQLTAETAIRSLKQGKRPVENYIAEFKRWARETEWNDISLRNQFRLGLSDSLKDELARTDLPATLDLLVHLSISIDRRLRERRAEKTSQSISIPRNLPPPASEVSMKIATLRGPLSLAEKARRRSLNLCLYCASPEHTLAECATLKRKTGGKAPQNPKIMTVMPSTTCYIKLPMSLQWDQQRLHVEALIDTGACGNFIDVTFVTSNKIPIVTKHSPVSVRLIDGTALTSGPICSHTQPIMVTTPHNHVEYLSFDVIPSPLFPVILGLPWLKLHQPSLKWETDSLELNSHYCQQTCYPKPSLLHISPTEVPIQYQEFADVFNKRLADTLPPHRSYDCPIDLIPGSTMPSGRIYPLSQPELEHLKEYLEENLNKGFIRPSTSPAGAGMFFVRNKDQSLRPIIDYRELNKITLKNKYPLPLIPELLERLQSAKFFTKLDLKGAYNLIRIRSGDEWKTAFRTRYGLYEYLVMPFGLCNAPATFQFFINDIFRDLLDICVVVYLDDILIYSNNLLDHRKHVRWVLSRLRIHNLYAKLEKCIFESPTITFLGYIVSPQGLQMEQNKVDCVINWPIPHTRKALQRFLGFSNYYRKFIKNFSKVVKPLTTLTSTLSKFRWTTEAQSAFDELKTRFTSAPILQLPDPLLQYTLEVDASETAIGAVLSQRKSLQTPLHPVAFYSRMLNSAEINYPVGEKELLAIKASLENWRHLLEGTTTPIIIYTDHRNLQYLKNNKTLSSRQVRWSFFLDRFNFVITYRPGSKNGKADSLSRIMEKTETPQCPTTIIPPERIIGITIPLKQQIQEALSTDSSVQSLDLTQDTEGFWYKDSRMYVPPSMRVHVLKILHDAPLAGHPGVSKTLHLMKRYFWWPNMTKTVQDFVLSCVECATSKHTKGRPYGLLTNLPIPHNPWEAVSLDFIVELPLSKSHNTILVVVDALTKMAHFIALKKLPTSAETAEVFISHIVKLHGLPKRLTSDRGTQFVSKFWKALCLKLQIDHRLSSAYHPQTNGQTERINQCLEQYLRCYCTHLQDDWCDLLPLAEFSYNNTVSSTTNQTPFYSNYGFHPNPLPVNLIQTNNPSTENYFSRLQGMSEYLRTSIQKAQLRQKKYYDLRRRTPPPLCVGDLVWLSTKNLNLKTPSRKFSKLYIGPYPIQKIINEVTFRLTLPPELKIHPTFHVSLLKPHKANTFPHRSPIPPPPILVQGEPEFEVEKILDSRKVRNKLQYLVRWKNYGQQDDSWEMASGVHAPRLVRQFHLRYPHKPAVPLTHGVGPLGRGSCNAAARSSAGSFQ